MDHAGPGQTGSDAGNGLAHRTGSTANIGAAGTATAALGSLGGLVANNSGKKNVIVILLDR